jgi:NAD(P)-dependent dehydrogenase (short-subunit alcohol dehydrogenase family)
VAEELAGRVAVVTGASRGIGKAIAQRFAAEGARVVATSRTLRPGDSTYAGSLEETVAEITAAGGAAIAVAADLGDPSCDRAGILRAGEEAFGDPVDVVVHNAAGTRRFDLTFADMTREAFLHSVEVNVWSAWELARLAVPGMRERGAGWIVNISSVQAGPRVGPPFAPNVTAGACLYGGTKAMVDRLSTGAAMDLFEDGIAVNALSPEAGVATEHAMTVTNLGAHRSEPLETMAEATLALCTGDPRVLTGRVAYSLSLLVELDRPVRTLDGRSLLEGWQPADIDRARLYPGYLSAFSR